MARQFDPVAAAAMGALDAAQNGIQQFQSQTNAPQLPAQATVASSARQLVQGLSQFSPFNVLARGSLPSGLPAPPQLPFGQSAFEPPALRDIGGGGGGGAPATDGGSRTSAFE